MKTSIKLVGLLSISILFASLGCKNNKGEANNIKNETIVNSLKGEQEKQGEIVLLSPSEFKEKSENYQIVDVRTPSEFNKGFIKGAKNINMRDGNFEEKIISLDKQKPVFIYCRSGHRSGITAKKMVELGFKEVYDLQGGILNWKRNKNSIEK